jgi:acyl-CoA synthetase (NDP forming)
VGEGGGSVGAPAARRLLPEPEAYSLLHSFGLPVPEWCFARTAEEAGKQAPEVGFPVVLKVVSPDVVHKSDVGGVRLGLTNAQEVVDACGEITAAVKSHLPDARISGWLVVRQITQGVELVAGMVRDPVFGRVIMFGSGGILVELMRDVSFRAAPLSEDDARTMIAETRASRLLEGVRGRPRADAASVVRLLVALSKLVEASPEITEIDLNPVIAGPSGALVVDARIIAGAGSEGRTDRGSDVG